MKIVFWYNYMFSHIVYDTGPEGYTYITDINFIFKGSQ